MHTLALLANSLTRPFPGCSKVSRTNVNGLAPSLRFNSFWNRSILCIRRCWRAEGAIFWVGRISTNNFCCRCEPRRTRLPTFVCVFNVHISALSLNHDLFFGIPLFETSFSFMSDNIQWWGVAEHNKNHAFPKSTICLLLEGQFWEI